MSSKLCAKSSSKVIKPNDATAKYALRSRNNGTLMAAGRRANADRVDALLLAGDAYSADAVGEVAQQGRDLDGGPARMRSTGVRLVHTPSS